MPLICVFMIHLFGTNHSRGNPCSAKLINEADFLWRGLGVIVTPAHSLARRKGPGVTSCYDTDKSVDCGDPSAGSGATLAKWWDPEIMVGH